MSCRRKSICNSWASSYGGGKQYASLIFPPTWYEPIVRDGDSSFWPQNPGPLVGGPKACISCHMQDDAGRLPALSTTLDLYCKAVLRSAVGAKAPPSLSPQNDLPGSNPPAAMPPSRPGALACTPNIPPADPRFKACTSIHTEDCTPAFADDDPRKGDPTFAVKCAPAIADLLRQCSAEVAPSTSLFRGGTMPFQINMPHQHPLARKRILSIDR